MLGYADIQQTPSLRDIVRITFIVLSTLQDALLTENIPNEHSGNTDVHLSG